MDYQRFAELLPSCYHDWGLPTVRPRSSRFEQVLQHIRGMTAANVLQLLNLAVACRQDEEYYLEVGCFQGATLVGALLEHPSCRALAVDNFSEFDPHHVNQDALTRNLAAFGLTRQVEFHGVDFEQYLLELRSRQIKVSVYLYDGAHDYRSQLMGLHLVAPLLSDRALIIVDDSNFTAVKQATWDFMAARPECRMLFDLPTPANCHPSFWNGLHVLAWDKHSSNYYDWDRLKSMRQANLLESLTLLQQFCLFRQGDRIHLERIP